MRVYITSKSYTEELRRLNGASKLGTLHADVLLLTMEDLEIPQSQKDLLSDEFIEKFPQSEKTSPKDDYFQLAYLAAFKEALTKKAKQSDQKTEFYKKASKLMRNIPLYTHIKSLINFSWKLANRPGNKSTQLDEKLSSFDVMKVCLQQICRLALQASEEYHLRKKPPATPNEALVTELQSICPGFDCQVSPNNQVVDEILEPLLRPAPPILPAFTQQNFMAPGEQPANDSIRPQAPY